MPNKNSVRENTLQELRKQFEEIELSDVRRRPPARSKQIQKDMNVIIAKELNRSVKNWGNKCRKIRESQRYTQKEVARLMKISHVNIVNQENKITCDVDPFYLEAFSLIYRVSPYRLLGIKRKRLISPLVATDPVYETYKNIIMGTLYDPKNEDKINILKALTTIGKMKQDALDSLIQLIQKIPNLQSVLCTGVPEHPMQNNRQWKDLWMWARRDRAEDAAETYDLRYCYLEADLVLQDLELHNPPVLELLAKFAAADPEVTKLLADIIRIGGIPESPKMLKTYNVGVEDKSSKMK